MSYQTVLPLLVSDYYSYVPKHMDCRHKQRKYSLVGHTTAPVALRGTISRQMRNVKMLMNVYLVWLTTVQPIVIVQTMMGATHVLVLTGLLKLDLFVEILMNVRSGLVDVSRPVIIMTVDSLVDVGMVMNFYLTEKHVTRQ